MNTKLILSIPITAIIAFVCGWYFHTRTSSVNPSAEVSKKSFNPKNKIIGKFILDGSDYAGFNFVNDSTVLWTNEMFPMDPDTLRLRWLSDKIFIARYTKKDATKNPNPYLWVREVVSYNGTRLVLNSIWTGSGKFPDEEETFTRN